MELLGRGEIGQGGVGESPAAGLAGPAAALRRWWTYRGAALFAGLDRNPEVKGTVGGRNPTQVRLYKSADCSGSVAAIGTVAQFAGTGIPINVPNNSTINLSARPFNAAGNGSICSNSITYRELR
jgi:hypothetical protein